MFNDNFGACKMNEQIQKFAEQAFLFASATDDSDESDANWWKEYNEKFAELIVKECLDELAVWRFSEPSEAWMLERNYGIDFCMDKIKESFGVEE
jgi:hypothetical protein